MPMCCDLAKPLGIRSSLLVAPIRKGPFSSNQTEHIELNLESFVKCVVRLNLFKQGRFKTKLNYVK